MTVPDRDDTTARIPLVRSRPKGRARVGVTGVRSIQIKNNSRIRILVQTAASCASAGRNGTTTSYPEVQALWIRLSTIDTTRPV